jgi:hypothetical protein
VLIFIQLLLLLPAEKHLWDGHGPEDNFFETAVVVVAYRARRWLMDMGIIKVEN